MNHQPLDLEDMLIAGQRILPDIKLRASDPGVPQREIADFAAIVAEAGDLAGIRRPFQHRASAADPAGVVGGVAVVFLSVEGQLRQLAGGGVAQPEVVLADEGGQAAVRGEEFVPRWWFELAQGVLRAEA